MGMVWRFEISNLRFHIFLGRVAVGEAGVDALPGCFGMFFGVGLSP
jgi:hypothetical protein